ncbi:hypothetical protein IAD21_06061 [Abditibacteriota bacterium]|nr:hypothetical protein IAD21_06061 [Abditibacteriota bacterium]
MPYYQEILTEAHESYDSGRFGDAILLFQQAAMAGWNLNRAEWFHCMLWASISASNYGDYVKSLELLITARADEPEDCPKGESWFVRTMFFFINLESNPLLESLIALLADLKDYAKWKRVPISDLRIAEGMFQEKKGDIFLALSNYESAWSTHSGGGYNKMAISCYAAIVCLRMRQVKSAKDWIKSLSANNVAHPFYLMRQSQLEIRITLLENSPDLNLLRTLQNQSLLMQNPSTIEQVRELTVRILLLDETSGNPTVKNHPSRIELRDRRRIRGNIHQYYERRLLLLDYRLACLRFVVGIPPVDDYYYAKPQQSANLAIVNLEKFSFCLRKSRIAAHNAMKKAKYIDDLFQCNYRQREVQARIDRIDEINCHVSQGE